MNAKLAIACLLLGACVGVRAAEPARGDFGYGAPLATQGMGSVYEGPVPMHLYEHTAFADLRDVRVLNSQHEGVPYALGPPQGARVAPARLALPIFPLRGDPSAATDKLRLKVTAAGTSIEINDPAAAPPGLPVAGYLLNAETLAAPAVALELAWDDAAGDFSARLRVEASNDLQVWRTVLADAPVVSLHYAGQQFTRTRVELPETAAKFLRLSWLGSGTALTGVTATLRSAQADLPRTHTRATGTATAGRAGEYQYDLGGAFPVDRLSLALAEENSLASVVYEARESPEGDWRWQANGTAYRLRVEGAPELTSAAVPVATCRCRYWRVRVLPSGGGLGAAPPALVAGWTQDNIKFLARGAAPFELVYGDSDVTGPGTSIEGLLAPVAGAGAAKLIAKAAVVGTPFEIGGPARLDRRHSLEFRRVAVLWAALLVAVALLLRMAWRLLKSSSRAQGG